MARPVFNRKGMKVPGMFQAGGNIPKNKPKQGGQRQIFNTDSLSKAKQDLAKDSTNFQRFQQANQFDASMTGGNMMLDDRTRQQAQTYMQGMKDQQSLINTVEAAMRENIELKKQMQVQAAEVAQKDLINSGRKKQKDLTNASTPMQMGGNLGKTKFDVINGKEINQFLL